MYYTVGPARHWLRHQSHDKHPSGHLCALVGPGLQKSTHLKAPLSQHAKLDAERHPQVRLEQRATTPGCHAGYEAVPGEDM